MTLIDADRAHELYGVMGTGIEMSGGSAANTMTGIASFGGKVAYIGKVADDQLGDVFGHDLRAVGVTFENAPVAVRRQHRPVPHRGHAGRAAHDEHLPRRVVAARPGRRGRGDGAAGPRRLPRGLPLRPAAGQGGLLQGGCAGPQGGREGVADAVRLVLRRPPPRRLLPARRVGGGPALRQRGRAEGALPGRRLRRRAAGRAGSLRGGGHHPRRGGLGGGRAATRST